MTDSVLFEEIGCANGSRLGVATLNAPRTLNALSLDMANALGPALAAWAADPAIALVVLQGQGDRAFCAGGDLQGLYREMRAHPAGPGADTAAVSPAIRAFFEHEYRLDHEIHTYPKPVLCWGHGVVMGGGMGLMSGASHRVVTEQSRLAMPEIVIGLFPDVAASWFLNRMPGEAGLFLALTGAALQAADALFVGWADHAIDHAHKPRVMDRLVAHAWTGDRGQDDRALDAVLKEFAAAPQPAIGPLRKNLPLIDSLCAAPALPDIVAAIVNLSTDDPWLHAAASALRAGAPGSARLGYELLKRTRHLSLAEVFRLDFELAVRCAALPDFAEGIRALLIDKDKTPRWRPATIAEADEAWADAQFAAAAALAGARHPLADLGAAGQGIKAYRHG